MKALLTVAFYVLLFSNLPGVAFAAQITSIILLAVCATIVVAIRLPKITRISFFEVSLIVCCFASVPSAVFIGGPASPVAFGYIISFSILTLLVVLSIGVICSRIHPESLLQAASRAFVAMIATVAIFFSEELLIALTPGAAERWSLRVRAFHLHPNLEGIIFAGGAIVLLRQALGSRGLKQLGLLALSAISLLVVLGASARGSLVAFVIAGVILIAISFPRLNKNLQVGLLISLIFGAAIGALLAGPIWEYLYEVLELGSTARGLGSGGTGRVELWQRGLALFGSSPSQSLFGGGLRWSTAEYIGFSVESSYITVLLDSGILAGGLLLVAMFIAFAKSCFWMLYDQRAELPDVVTSYFLLFCLVQGFFNRYLIALGNPFSILVLFLFAYASRGLWKWKGQLMPEASRMPAF